LVAAASRLALASVVLATAGCVDPLTPDAKFSPAWDVKNVRGYGETVAGLPPDKVYGWDLRVAAGTARWRACDAPDACTTSELERPAGELVAFRTVGQIALADGNTADVLELTVEARPRYVVPNGPPRR
jgi:hypothetical protein